MAISRKPAKKNIEKGRSLGHVTTSRARDLKFGIQMHSGNISKTRKENLEKGRGLGHVTPILFGVPPNVSSKQVKLET